MQGSIVVSIQVTRQTSAQCCSSSILSSTTNSPQCMTDRSSCGLDGRSAVTSFCSGCSRYHCKQSTLASKQSSPTTSRSAFGQPGFGIGTSNNQGLDYKHKRNTETVPFNEQTTTQCFTATVLRTRGNTELKPCDTL